MTPTTYIVLSDDQNVIPGERHHISVQFSQGDPAVMDFEFDGSAPYSDFLTTMTVHLGYRDADALATEQAGAES
jgi:hypothetical protein